MLTRSFLFAAAVVAAGSGMAAVAGDISLSADPKIKGRQIAEESERRNVGFGDTQAVMKMVLESAQKEVSVRELRMSTLEQPAADVGDSSLIVFDRPTDVAGTALLTHAKILDPDDQWIYIPAVSRIKRISSANRSGPFLGSEFAYEDFSTLEVGKYQYLWLRDERCPKPNDGLECHVVERRPLYENSGYLRQIAWFDRKEYQVRTVAFYNRQDALLKTLTLADYRQYLGKYWRAHDLYMQNHVSGRATRVRWLNFAFKTGLTQAAFDPDALTRMR